MRSRWVLPLVFGIIAAGLLISSGAARPTTATAATEVQIPRVYLESTEAESWLARSPADEAADFASDTVTEAIAAEYSGPIDPGSAVTARAKPDTDSIIIVEAEGGSATDAQVLADTAAEVFASQRKAEQINAVTAQIEGLTEQSDELQREIEELVILDFTTRSADAPGAATPDQTPIQVVIEPLAGQRAEVDALIASFEQAEAAIRLSGPTVTQAARVTRSGSGLGVGMAVLLVAAAAALGFAVSARNTRRRPDPVVEAAPAEPEIDNDPMAWIDLLTAEPDGVFIDLTTEPIGWDSPSVAAAHRSAARTRARSALEAAEMFLAASGDTNSD